MLTTTLVHIDDKETIFFLFRNKKKVRSKANKTGEIEPFIPKVEATALPPLK